MFQKALAATIQCLVAKLKSAAGRSQIWKRGRKFAAAEKYFLTRHVGAGKRILPVVNFSGYTSQQVYPETFRKFTGS